MKKPETIRKDILGFLIDLANKKKEEIESIQSTINQIIRPIIKTPMVNLLEPLAANTPLPLKVKGTKVLQPTTILSPKSKLDDKIAYALTKLESGFREDILEEIMALYPEKGSWKVSAAIAVRLSYLLKSGCIKGRLIGRRYEYSLANL